MAENTLPFIPTIEDMDKAIEHVGQMFEEDPEFHREVSEGSLSGNPMALGPRLPSVDEWTRLQIKGSRDNAAKWLARVTKPKKNFKEEALKQTSRDRYKNSMERVLANDLWAGGMELVDESETMAIITKRGASVYQKGVEDREPKIRRRIAELREARLAACLAVDALPVATDSEREAKMIANLHALKAIGRKRRGA